MSEAEKGGGGFIFGRIRYFCCYSHVGMLIPEDGCFLIVWFSDCVLGKSGQIVNPIIAKVNPILYDTCMYTCMFMFVIANVGNTCNLQLIDTCN